MHLLYNYTLHARNSPVTFYVTIRYYLFQKSFDSVSVASTEVVITVKHKNIPLNERIIFALDVDSKEEAEKWVDCLGDQ